MKKKTLILIGILTAAALSAKAGGNLSGYDRQIIASCMVLEAGCDGSEGMQAVLNVILNRADGYIYRMIPETVRHGSFSCMHSIWNNPEPDYGPLISQAQNQPSAFAEAMHLISVMEQGLLWDNTFGATHYHAASIEPYWASGMRYLTTIGHHHFYMEQGNEIASLPVTHSRSCL